MRLTDFEALTFDCYGTLIDWETGIFEALAPWIERAGVTRDRDHVLEAFAECETREQEASPKTPYPEILVRVHRGLARRWGATSTDRDAAAFGASVGDWPSFADSPEALAYLKRHYKLVIVSNVDRASFALSNQRLGVEFDAVITAQDVGSYKPDPANFRALLERLAGMGIDKSRILHTAQSLFHDHVPAKEAGLATCWIDRRGGHGGGATTPPESQVTPDFRFVTMAEMAERHRAELGRFQADG